MVIVENVYSHLNKLADVKLAEKWDNVGLMLGDYNNEVNKVSTSNILKEVDILF